MTLPLAELYEPEPYYGCPACESRECGRVGDTDDGVPVYECHDCHTRYLGVSGVHYSLGLAGEIP